MAGVAVQWLVLPRRLGMNIKGTHRHGRDAAPVCLGGRFSGLRATRDDDAGTAQFAPMRIGSNSPLRHLKLW